MKNMLKYALLPVLLLVGSCDDWTEPESLKIKTPTIDAGLRADYIENLKAYKTSPHKVLFVTFDNIDAAPSGQADRLSVLPDSTDFVSLDHPEALHPVMAREFGELRAKGTRVIYDVDFLTIETEWQQLVKDDASEAKSEADALDYIALRTEERLALCDAKGFDGVTFSYAGRSFVSLTDAERPIYTGRQDAFFGTVVAWREAHRTKHCSFVGNPQYLTVENAQRLSDCDFIVVPTDAATNESDLSVRVLAAVDGGNVPTDRIVVTAQTTRYDDKDGIYGYFGTLDDAGNRIHAIAGCARWVGEASASLTRAGLFVRNAKYDYYDNRLVYYDIRRAIAVMNPTPQIR